MLRFLTAGESHGPELVAIVDGLPAGIGVDQAAIDRDLARRQGGYGRGARSTRIERDTADVVSGVVAGRTTGAPVAMRIVNRDFSNQPADPSPLTAPRPGHADLAGGLKFGIDDFRVVRERASARETAARVAVGAFAKAALAPFGARVGSFVLAIGGAAATHRPLPRLDDRALWELHDFAEQDPVRCPDARASAEMRRAIDAARAAGDTLGGVFCVFATGVPPGLGSYTQWDHRIDGLLARALCSIPAVKGAEVGPAFELSSSSGLTAQDAVRSSDGRLERGANHAGGVEGGVTNGQPVVLRAAMKPLSSVRAPVETVDLSTGASADAPYVRSDVCAVPAAAVVGEAVVAWTLAAALVERFGGDRLDGMLAAAAAVREAGVRGSASGARAPSRAEAPR